MFLNAKKRKRSLNSAQLFKTSALLKHTLSVWNPRDQTIEGREDSYMPSCAAANVL